MFKALIHLASLFNIFLNSSNYCYTHALPNPLLSIVRLLNVNILNHYQQKCIIESYLSLVFHKT
jgi:hypothetical protein